MTKRSNPFFEPLEARKLMTATSLPSYAGQYETIKGGAIYDLNLTAGSTVGSYTGTVSSNQTVDPVTAAEESSGVLDAVAQTSSGNVDFTASLSGKDLIITYIASGKQVGLLQVSTTPAPAQPTLESFTGSYLNYLAPANWTATQSSSGLLLQSPDKTAQVGVVGVVTEGSVTLSSIASAEQAAGVKLLYGKVLASKTTAKEVFQSGAAIVTFTAKGTTYVGFEAVETYTLPNKGTYDAKTKKYSGVTLSEVYEAAAPKAEFVNYNSTLLYMLKNIKPSSNLTSGTVPKGAKKAPLSNTGLSVPGTPGSTKKSKKAANALFNNVYANNYYDIAEGDLLQYETLESEAVSDAAFNEVDAELRS
jgi:hypothetical protein